MAFVPGQKLRASDLNLLIPRVAYVAADVTVNNSITMVDATGLSFSLDANSKYIWDCGLYYTSNETADMKCQWLGPTGVGGTWGLYGIQASANTVNAGGVLEAFRMTGYGTGNVQSVSGSDDFSGVMICRPSGYVFTGGTSGTWKMQFAQNVANVSNTIIRVGSWVSLTRVI